ncbi:NUDIX hydrolase [Neisseria bacilliformis ATCC BAA-1200]|uniref:NUDIX hydrolase n=1 Tax=Neisseria bacilliformis ATCC BAA-1200 TaxID=888742 RepID=F2BG52_9NEIS|nr:NUDIX hydrolase [Neisseria bacilliformis ATCC BAA-1200]
MSAAWCCGRQRPSENPCRRPFRQRHFSVYALKEYRRERPFPFGGAADSI